MPIAQQQRLVNEGMQYTDVIARAAEEFTTDPQSPFILSASTIKRVVRVHDALPENHHVTEILVVGDDDVREWVSALINGVVVPVTPSAHAFDRLCELLGEATKTIDICMYAFIDPQVTDALLASPALIRVIVDRTGSDPNTELDRLRAEFCVIDKRIVLDGEMV
ncbi:hypothetical protein Gpo141_00011017 [Globisporangium polare]